MAKLHYGVIMAVLLVGGAQVYGMRLARTHVHEDLMAVLGGAVADHHGIGCFEQDGLAGDQPVTLHLEFNLFNMPVDTVRWLMHVINSGYPIERILADIKQKRSGPLAIVNLTMNDFAHEYIKMVCEYDGQFGSHWAVDEIPGFVRSIELLLGHPAVSVEGDFKEDMIIWQCCCRHLQSALGALWKEHGIMDTE